MNIDRLTRGFAETLPPGDTIAEARNRTLAYRQRASDRIASLESTAIVARLRDRREQLATRGEAVNESLAAEKRRLERALRRGNESDIAAAREALAALDAERGSITEESVIVDRLVSEANVEAEQEAVAILLEERSAALAEARDAIAAGQLAVAKIIDDPAVREAVAAFAAGQLFADSHDDRLASDPLRYLAGVERRIADTAEALERERQAAEVNLSNRAKWESEKARREQVASANRKRQAEEYREQCERARGVVPAGAVLAKY